MPRPHPKQGHNARKANMKVRQAKMQRLDAFAQAPDLKNLPSSRPVRRRPTETELREETTYNESAPAGTLGQVVNMERSNSIGRIVEDAAGAGLIKLRLH